jgi:hypothetical protein
MKAVGAFFIFFAWVSLSETFNWAAIGWLLFGVFLVASKECLAFLTNTERFVHRRKECPKMIF